MTYGGNFPSISDDGAIPDGDTGTLAGVFDLIRGQPGAAGQMASETGLTSVDLAEFIFFVARALGMQVPTGQWSATWFAYA